MPAASMASSQCSNLHQSLSLVPVAVAVGKYLELLQWTLDAWQAREKYGLLGSETLPALTVCSGGYRKKCWKWPRSGFLRLNQIVTKSIHQLLLTGILWWCPIHPIPADAAGFNKRFLIFKGQEVF